MSEYIHDYVTLSSVTACVTIYESIICLRACYVTLFYVNFMSSLWRKSWWNTDSH